MGDERDDAVAAALGALTERIDALQHPVPAFPATVADQERRGPIAGPLAPVVLRAAEQGIDRRLVRTLEGKTALAAIVGLAGLGGAIAVGGMAGVSVTGQAQLLETIIATIGAIVGVQGVSRQIAKGLAKRGRAES